MLFIPNGCIIYTTKGKHPPEKKSNRSEIMRNAWNAYNAEKRERSYRGLAMNKTFGYFLKMAWIGAKNKKKAAERDAAKQDELAKLAENKQKFNRKASFEGCDFRLWEKGENRRIYIADETGAYIDLSHNNTLHIKSLRIREIAERFLAAYTF